jgi:hypothetical protein
MEQVRARAEAIVNDPNTAEALKPYYRQFCKRPCFHDEYLDTFNRPNVTLVHTDGQGIERITERGIVANGVEYELDCIIFASGFEVGTPLERRAGYEVYGRDGVALSQKWRERRVTMFGMQTHDFPNCFIVGLSQTGVSANIPHVLDVQSRHIGYILKHAHDHQVRTFDVTAEAEADWVKKGDRCIGDEREVPGVMHAGLLQQRRTAERPADPAQRFVRAGHHGVLVDPRCVAQRRNARGDSVRHVAPDCDPLECDLVSPIRGRHVDSRNQSGRLRQPLQCLHRAATAA